MLVSFDPRNDQDANDALDIIIQFMGVTHVQSRAKMSDPATPHTIDTKAQAPNDPAADSQADVSHTAPPVTNGVDPNPPALDAQAGVELDVNGTPWIAEVHAGTKTKTAKGVWKAKRGVDKEVIAQTEQAARDKIAGTPQPTLPTEPVVPQEQMPAPVIEMDVLSAKWDEAVGMGAIDPAQGAQIYAHLGVQAEFLQNNETMRATLYNYIVGQIAQLQMPPAQMPSGLPGA